MTAFEIRPVEERDRARIIEIFNYYVIHDFSAYPSVPVPDGFFDLLQDGAHAFHVVERDGAVIGFGLLRPFMPFDSFSRTATVSYFIFPSHTGKGGGSLLLSTLIANARKKGIAVLLASISSKNKESLRFHAYHGFTERGRLRNVGSKFGCLFDVVWMEKELGTAPSKATNHT